MEYLFTISASCIMGGLILFQGDKQAVYAIEQRAENCGVKIKSGWDLYNRRKSILSTALFLVAISIAGSGVRMLAEEREAALWVSIVGCVGMVAAAWLRAAAFVKAGRDVDLMSAS
jgi:hypothetical protein